MQLAMITVTTAQEDIKSLNKDITIKLIYFLILLRR